MKVVLFLIDACRYDYISKDHTPFLWECSEKGKHIKHVIPSAGFCERTEIFTGLRPNESGFFTAIGFDPDSSPYKNNFLLNLVGKLEILVGLFNSKRINLSKFFRKIMLKILRGYFSRFKLRPYNIPFVFLKYFNLTEDEFEMTTNDIAGSTSLFKMIEMKGEHSYLDAFTSLGKPSNGSDEDRIDAAILAASKKDYLFTPVYIGVIDSEGHKFGPDSKELKSELNRLDTILRNSVQRFLEIDKKTSFVFLGDHGMTEVKSDLDVELIIIQLAKSLKLKKGKDYVYFLDSTMVRVWFLTENAKIKLGSLIRENEVLSLNGEVIDDETSKLYDIPIGDRRYGDIAWWANEGVLIFPDFFHDRKPYSGMHGYKPIHSSTHGTCIAIGEDITHSYLDSMNLHEVYDLISGLIEN